MWEIIEMRIEDAACSDRLKVPGGWIVRSYTSMGKYSNEGGIHQIFISDVNHTWILK
jgi:hypothetical protein